MSETDIRQENAAEAIIAFQEATLRIHKAFGAPGDYGYGTPKGDALQGLYAALNAASGVGKKARAGELKMCMSTCRQALADLRDAAADARYVLDCELKGVEIFDEDRTRADIVQKLDRALNLFPKCCR